MPYAWQSNIPDFLCIEAPERIESLEAVRKKYSIDNDLFVRLICGCIGARRRYYPTLDRLLMIQRSVSDPKQRRVMIFFSRIQELATAVQKNAEIRVPVDVASRHLTSVSENPPDVSSFEKMIIACLHVDRLLGLLYEDSSEAMEVDKIVASAASPLGMVEYMRHLQQKLSDDKD